jgi:hypothetical protein
MIKFMGCTLYQFNFISKFSGQFLSQGFIQFNRI